MTVYFLFFLRYLNWVTFFMVYGPFKSHSSFQLFYNLFKITFIFFSWNVHSLWEHVTGCDIYS